MSFPKQNEIELPLLKTVHELGGKAEPKELYPRLAKIFTQLTQEDLTARLPSSSSTFRWRNSKLGRRRYFAVFSLFFFAVARRSAFLRRTARFLTLSLP